MTSCQGADTCNLAVTSSRAVASAITARLEADGLGADGDAAKTLIKVSGCPNSCGQHHIADLGFHGGAKNTGDGAVPVYQLHLGGGVDERGARFGRQVVKIIARRVPEAVVRLLRFYEAERTAGESPAAFFERVDGKRVVAALGDVVTAPPARRRARRRRRERRLPRPQRRRRVRRVSSPRRSISRGENARLEQRDARRSASRSRRRRSARTCSSPRRSARRAASSSTSGASSAGSCPVTFIDTGFLFAETLAYRERARRAGSGSTCASCGPTSRTTRLRRALRRRHPANGSRLLLRREQGRAASRRSRRAPARGSPACAAIRAARARTSRSSRREGHLVRVHPIATLTHADVAAYLARHGIPEHPLVARRYLSIGCAPCTRAVADGEDERAGRWAGSTKTECGLHARADPARRRERAASAMNRRAFLAGLAGVVATAATGVALGRRRDATRACCASA